VCIGIELDGIANIKKIEDVSSQASERFKWIESICLVDLDSSRYFHNGYLCAPAPKTKCLSVS